MGPWTLIISSAVFALLSWLGYHIRSVIVDNCTHCDTGEGGQDPQKSFEGYAERAEQWSRGELPDWDVAVSGPASKAEADELKPFFDWLGSFLSSRNISSIVDVSSGHWPSGWQRGVKWSGQDYTGLDITPKMIEDNRAFFKYKDPQQYGLRSVTFEVGDMLKELPKADLLITKDTIIHIPNWAILKFLETNVNVCPPRYREVLFIHDRPPNWKFRWGAVPLVRHIVRNWDCPGFSDFHEIDLRVAPYHLDVVNLFEFNSSTRADRVMDNPKVVQYMKTSCPGSWEARSPKLESFGSSVVIFWYSKKRTLMQTIALMSAGALGYA